jgi:hypothetical protein
MSGLAAHNMSALSYCREATNETDGMASGDPEDEIRGVYGEWQGKRLTQEEAAEILGVRVKK